MIVLDKPDQIMAFHLLAQKGALKLETVGMRHSSGRSVAPLIRERIGSKTRDKTKLLAEFEQWLREQGVLVPAEWRTEYRSENYHQPWELKEGTAHRGFYPTKEAAEAAIRKLGGGVDE